MCDIQMKKLNVTLGITEEEEIRAEHVGSQKEKRKTKDYSDSEDDISSLEESVEEHKQPQTEEIMNAELVARVIFPRLH
jgi:hypothetical protein